MDNSKNSEKGNKLTTLGTIEKGICFLTKFIHLYVVLDHLAAESHKKPFTWWQSSPCRLSTIDCSGTIYK